MTAIMRAQTVAVPMPDYAPNVKRFALVQRGSYHFVEPEPRSDKSKYAPKKPGGWRCAPLLHSTSKGARASARNLKTLPLDLPQTRGHLQLVRTEINPISQRISHVFARCTGGQCAGTTELCVRIYVWIGNIALGHTGCKPCASYHANNRNFARNKALAEQKTHNGLLRRVRCEQHTDQGASVVAVCEGPRCDGESERLVAISTWISGRGPKSCAKCANTTSTARSK